MNIKQTILAATAILTMGFSAQAQTVLVSNVNAGTIGLYNASTGATIDADFITGLGGPYGITHDSSAIYVTNIFAGVVSKFDLTTGAAISEFSSFPSVVNPTGIAINNGVLYVADAAGTIGTYDAVTGAAINSSLISVGGVVRLFELYNNQLYVGDATNNVVKVYGLDGSTINASFASVNTPSGLAFSGTSMFVTSADFQLVTEFNATTGAYIGTPITSGLSTPIGLAVNSDGNLLVANAFGTVGLYETNGTLISGSFLAGTDGPIGLDIIAVPEPSVLSLAAVSGMGIAFLGRRRSQK